MGSPAKGLESLPPPPPVIPSDIVPLQVPEASKKVKAPQRLPMARPGVGKAGKEIDLLANHFKVALFYEDGHPVDGKDIGRRVIDQVQATYASDLGALEAMTMMEGPEASDRKRMKRPYRSKTIKAEISFAAKIPVQSIANVLRGVVSLSGSHFSTTILGISSTWGVGFWDAEGFHSSIRATQRGLTLNMDVSTTMIVKPGPVVDFLLTNQNVKDPHQVDWNKAKRMLKNLRIKTNHSNIEYKITGLSDLPCGQQTFDLKQKGGGQEGNEVQSVEITVFDYFVNHRGISLHYSAEFPCINVGKPKRPSYLPLELCTLVSLQRYTKALTNQQRATLVEKSRQKPTERMDILRDVGLTTIMLIHFFVRFAISIDNQFTEVRGRVLPTPSLKVGNNKDFYPRNGRWNFNDKKLVNPVTIQTWAIVNFSARYDRRNLCNTLLRCAEMKGINLNSTFEVFEEICQVSREPAPYRVDKMIEMAKSKLLAPPQLLLCILPERKNSEIYGPWKRKCLVELGVPTQCIAPIKINDQYITNVLLKINAKLGGMNSSLKMENSTFFPLVPKIPTMILGMDVSHGSPGRSDVPSIAAVVSSRNWPSVSHYRASVRTQSPKAEMIANLFNPVSDTKDNGIISELLDDFYNSSGKKPDQIIIFRDGVSESQFNQVLNMELQQIIEACKFKDVNWSPRFMVIIAQKNHHTKFFQRNSPQNVPPGTVVDNSICHPRNYDFYLCAHAGMIGTTRPVHYHVLHDELGFSADELQELVHSLSYVYQRSTTAVSLVAPVCYAHLAAAQMGQFMKFDEMSETSSSHNGVTSAAAVPVPEMPRLHKYVHNSMFFC
ncbi:hypothetical protein Pint_05698 [Pistacia integerrima]|uniref:Uncharacterized protein n=1 Tax=Pistacia integerrima TaxID=434235 RepID=A0ACC0Z780_9ROSI|nr:hypothetical protein Pint_05698 [Pistacia integerrima]